MKSRLLFIILSMSSVSAIAQSTGKSNDELYKQFIDPPASARPRVWWHWMNGNITKEGIRKDLEWMHRVGIGGFQNFDASLLTPQIVEKRLTYMTPDWQDAFRFTTRLADSLKLEMAIAGSPGWSESGGPWVKPEDGMKKIVWTEARVQGGAANINIPRPSGTTGPFQNIPKQPGFGETVDPSKLTLYYKDIAVVACRLPDDDKSPSELGAQVSSSGGQFSLQQLTDGDLATTNLLPRDSANGIAWIQFTFPNPQMIKAITIVGGGNPGVFGQGADAVDSRKLEASDDGEHFRMICTIPPGAIVEQTISIPVTSAKIFRVTFKNPPTQYNAFGAMLGMDAKPVTPPGTQIAEIFLHAADVIDRFEEKAAFAPVGDLNKKMSRPTDDVVSVSDIIDLTGRMKADGSLDWTAPQGEWKILRFGYSLLGIDNHPASPEATGPEVDKLDPVAVKNYFENYLEQYARATGGLMGEKGGLRFMVTDSWEAGAQNWTGNLPEEFLKRRGYPITPWLPVLSGQIIHSSAWSEKFLFDFRKTLSEMVAEYHYDALTRILDARGMKRYSESHEDGRALIADGMEVKRTAAVPMSALWTPNPFMNQNDQTKYTADIRESSSVAHIYGQNLVAAESLTALGIPSGAWSFCPENLKPSVDLELAHGLNRFVIHCSVHQPTDDKIPGLGLGPFGQWFNRHDTWAEEAKVWTDYLSRSSFLLQQGKFVADVVYYYGEDNNITSLFGKKLPDIPEGYTYDFINADALIHLLSVKNGNLVTPSGMTYRILVLDSNAKNMSMAVLKKIRDLVKAGARIAGIIPETSAGLKDDSANFIEIVDEIWKANNPQVFSNKNLAEVFNSLHVQPDFKYDKTASDTKLLYVHRKLADRDIYWVDNRNNRDENLDADFRIVGKKPEIWNPETGRVEAASYQIVGGRTKVILHLQPNQAVFIVFREKTAINSQNLSNQTETVLSTIVGAWEVKFQSGRGAPATASFNELSSWTTNSDPGIKYFSGTATYSKTFDANPSWFQKGIQIWIDLGNVKNLAEVILNGKPLGIVWKPPFKVEIGGALKTGTNELDIKVTNLWVNRLIGDQQAGVEKKITYTTFAFYKASSPLLPSGLMGPVRIIEISNRKQYQRDPSH